MYSPPLNFNRMTTFTYTVDDGVGHTGAADVMVHVGPINDEPVVHSGPDKNTVEGRRWRSPGRPTTWTGRAALVPLGGCRRSGGGRRAE